MKNHNAKKLLGYYDYTVILTYMGMICAFWAILDAINNSYTKSILLLMLAGVCDMFDGTVAATKERTGAEKRFGIQIDSMSDLVSFGIMPAIFVYMICAKTGIAALTATVFALAALIRLAYYNVCEEERQRTTVDRRSVFQGLPVTTIAVLLPIVYVFQTKRGEGNYLPYMLLLILCGVGFLIPIEIKKPKIFGKICLIIVGLVEAMCVFFFGRYLI